jgi:hypothetical protein
MHDLYKQRLQAAVVGFNFGLSGYVLARYVPLFLAGRNVGWSWFWPQLAIGLVVATVLAGVAYGAMSLMQK